MSRVQKFFTKDLMVRVAAADTTEIVREMCDTQSTFALASIALGRALTGAILMASHLREGQQIGIHFGGDGPLGFIFAESNFESQARGYCPNPQVVLPLKEAKLDVAGAVGKGMLTVTRSQPFQKQPHNGIVPITTGEVSQDLAFYLYQSHQIPSVVSLSVHLDGAGTVLAAGGVLVEVMAGATDEILQTLTEKSSRVPSLSSKLLDKQPMRTIVERYLHDSELVEIEHPHDIRYTCRCTPERVERTLTLSGKSTLAEMALKGEEVPVTCQFCGRLYVVTVAQIRKILDSLKAE